MVECTHLFLCPWYALPRCTSTAADSITHLRQDEVAKCTARSVHPDPSHASFTPAHPYLLGDAFGCGVDRSMAAWSYGIADLPELLPRLRDAIPVVQLEDETLEPESGSA